MVLRRPALSCIKPFFVVGFGFALVCVFSFGFVCLCVLLFFSFIRSCCMSLCVLVFGCVFCFLLLCFCFMPSSSRCSKSALQFLGPLQRDMQHVPVCLRVVEWRCWFVLNALGPRQLWWFLYRRPRILKGGFENYWCCLLFSNELCQAVCLGSGFCRVSFDSFGLASDFLRCPP